VVLNNVLMLVLEGVCSGLACTMDLTDCVAVFTMTISRSLTTTYSIGLSHLRFVTWTFLSLFVSSLLLGLVGLVMHLHSLHVLLLFES